MNKFTHALLLCAAVTGTTAQADVLAALGHVHNVAFGGEQRDTLLLGAHHGLYAYDGSGPRQVSTTAFDIMGLAAGNDGITLYASGHPQGGGNTGLLRSADGGKTFEPVSGGLEGPVDFHQLTVSPADPEVIYGVHGGLQVSHDGGKRWSKGGALPPKLLKLAASGLKPQRLFAASEQGLFISEDGGDNWQGLLKYPATTVRVVGDSVYAFVVGRGLIRAREADFQWQEINNGFGSQVLLDLAVSGDGNRIVGLSQYGALVQSLDQGRNWSALPAKPAPVTAMETRGRELYQANCQGCHGTEAVGETYSIEGLTTQGYLFAPALNGSMHAWHHTDDQLVETILEGSPRTDKMPAWKATLDEENARDIIAYLKTLWGETQKRCQGPGHMDRACLQGQ